MMTRVCVLCGRRYNWMENFILRRFCRECEDKTDCSHIVYDGCKELTLLKTNTEQVLQPFNLEENDTSSKSNFNIGLSNFPKVVTDRIQLKKQNVKEYL